MEETKKKPGCLKLILIGFCVFLFFGFLATLCSDSDSDNKNDSNNEVEVVTEQTTPKESPKKPEKPETNWYYRQQTDPMTSKTNYFASIRANEKLNFEFPYNGGSTADLTIRDMDGQEDVILQISKGQFISSYNGRVKVRFDEEDAFDLSYSEPADHSSDKIFLKVNKNFIKKLKTADKLLIQATFFNEGSRLMTFEVKGFEWDH